VPEAEVMARTATATAILAFVIVQMGCRGGVDQLEQAALNEFMSKYWGPDLFVDECTGLAFDPTAPVVVFSNSPGFSVTLLDVAALAPLDIKDAAVKEGGLEALARMGTIESVPISVDLSAYPFASVSDDGKPKEEWKPSDGYLLRFSNRVRFQGRIYLQTWIKASRTSSGTRIDYEFDDSGRLLHSRKQSRRCDDWG
jgi:hypothetical protein